MHSDILSVVSLTGEDRLRDAVRCIDNSGGEIALVVDECRRLIGSITDGDIRRALLRGLDLDTPAHAVMNRKPRFARAGAKAGEIADLMRTAEIRQVPIVDEEGVLVDIFFERDLQKPRFADNRVVIMAGGIGSRLRPITELVPKPMIEVGGRPILETILRRFKTQGFRRFTFCVNYRAEMIMDWFGDGQRFGVEIEYVRETQRMGTAGALSLLQDRPDKPLIVTNGDVLTTMDYCKLLEFHMEHAASATMCINVFRYQLPYGSVETNGPWIERIVEKPVQQFLINAGVYAVSPEALDHIPSGIFFDMPTLFERLGPRTCAAFPLHEYWLDVGQKADLERAQREFAEIFGEDTVVPPEVLEPNR